MERYIKAPVFEGLGVTHGFSTRVGGVSTGPYAWNNMYEGRGDDPGAVRHNKGRFLEELGLAGLATLKQVHGTTVVVVDSPGELQQEGDGVVTTTPGLGVGVYTADCVPVLLAAPGIVAAVHSGWRGTAAGVVMEAIRVMERLGARTEEIRAAVGPAIGPCCYEVGQEVAHVFSDLGFGRFVIPRDPRPHLDVPSIVVEQIVAMGVPRSSVWKSDLCTMCRDDLFYSYRRTGWPTGQMLSVIGIRS